MTSGFDYDPNYVATDLSRLLAYFAASESLAKRASSDKESFFAISELRKAEVFDVHRILVSTAVLLRERTEYIWPDPDVAVGLLFEGSEGIGKPLSVRGACNKIIHANHVDEDRGPEMPPPPGIPVKLFVVGPLTGKIILYGKQYNADWRAEIDVYLFVLAAYQAL